MAVTSKARKKDSPVYWIWQNVKARCSNPNRWDYKYYGARGISYPENWKTFEGFCEDMLEGFKPGLTLDRRDNHKDYSKDNCHWTTQKVQANNKRNNRVFTIHGLTKTFAQWIEETGVKSSTARQRYYVYGWNIERSLKLTKKEGY